MLDVDDIRFSHYGRKAVTDVRQRPRMLGATISAVSSSRWVV